MSIFYFHAFWREHGLCKKNGQLVENIEKVKHAELINLTTHYHHEYMHQISEIGCIF